MTDLMNFAHPQFGITYPRSSQSFAAALAPGLDTLGQGLGALAGRGIGEATGLSGWLRSLAIKSAVEREQALALGKAQVEDKIRGLYGAPMQLPPKPTDMPTQAPDLQFQPDTGQSAQAGQATPFSPGQDEYGKLTQPTGGAPLTTPPLPPEILGAMQKQGIYISMKPDPRNRLFQDITGKPINLLPSEAIKERSTLATQESPQSLAAARMYGTYEQAEKNRQSAEKRTGMQQTGAMERATLNATTRTALGALSNTTKVEANRLRELSITSRNENLKVLAGIRQQQADTQAEMAKIAGRNAQFHEDAMFIHLSQVDQALGQKAEQFEQGLKQHVFASMRGLFGPDPRLAPYAEAVFDNIVSGQPIPQELIAPAEQTQSWTDAIKGFLGIGGESQKPPTQAPTPATPQVTPPSRPQSQLPGLLQGTKTWQNRSFPSIPPSSGSVGKDLWQKPATTPQATPQNPMGIPPVTTGPDLSGMTMEQKLQRMRELEQQFPGLK